MSSNEPVREFDTNGNLIHCKSNSGYECWWEYDTNGKCIYSRDSNGYECWWEYDSDGNYIHYKSSEGFEKWYWEGKVTKDPVKILMLATEINSKVSQ
jgi:YD repeat-containing protein